ncbi:MAG: CPBP family intramembrane metalloprotease [Candidatus Velthaea sp.]
MKRVFIGTDGIRAGWRIVLFLAIFAATIAVLAGLGLVFARKALLEAPLTVKLPLQQLVSLLATAIATVVLARLERRSPWSFGLRDSSAPLRFAIGLLVGIACLIAQIVVLTATGHQTIEPGRGEAALIALYGLAWFALFALVALFEETFFRGYLLATLARGIRFRPAAAALSIVFGAGHIGNPGEGIIGAIGAGAFGLVLSFALYRSGSLWLPIGIHAGWDWGESWLFGTANSGLHLPGTLFVSHPRGAPLISGGSVGPEGSVLIFGVLLVMVAVVMRTYHGAGAFVAKQRP